MFVGRESSVLDIPRSLNGGIMKRTAKRVRRVKSADMRDEYAFDYSQAKPNRFAARMRRPVVAVVLEPDVASVFNSSASECSVAIGYFGPSTNEGGIPCPGS